MVWFVFLRGSLLLHDVTGKLSLAIGGLCPVLERGSCLLLVLQCYGFTKSWILLDGLSSRW